MHNLDMIASLSMVKTLTTTSLAGAGIAILLGIAALLGKNQLEDLREGQKINTAQHAAIAVTIEQMKGSDALLLQKLQSIERETVQNGEKLDKLSVAISRTR